MIHPLLMLTLLAISLLLTLRVEASGYPYQGCFEAAADLHGMPLDLLLAVAATESAWDPDARSHANAHGIMQIQWPGTARHLGVTRVAELYNPCLNIELGARYLRELMDRNDGDLERALASYNYGPGRIDAAAELPAGAQRYIQAVARQRERIGAGAADSVARSAVAAGTVVRFDHGARARRYAETLNARVSSAEFASRLDAEGYVVSMRLTAPTLSFADATLLQTLGWPGLGGEP